MSVNAVNSDGSLLRVAGGTLYADSPIGTISPFGGSAIPSGYLLCNGQAVSRTTYAELFAVIGTTYGSGNGTTTFNVPDLREATTKGVGLSGKSNNHYDSDGIALGEFIEDRVQDHSHYYISTDFGCFTGDGSACGIRRPPSSGDVINARKGDTTEVKAVGVNYIIKAKQVVVPFDVAEYIRKQNVLSEYENVTLPQNVEYTALYDGILIMGTPYEGELIINDIRIGYVTEGWGSGNFTVVVKKGDKVKYTGASYLFAKIAYYKLRDYN